MKRIVLFFCWISLLSACSEDDEGSDVLLFIGKEYVSLKVGQEAIYQIDSILYNEFTGRINVVSLQQREYISRTEMDAENRETFIVEIHTRAADSLPWHLNRITKRNLTGYRYEVLDNNVISVPLVFPIVIDKKWNANVLNTLITKEYKYKSVNEVFINDSMRYDSTVSVLQFEEENLIEKLYEKETYAADVGLIFREHNEIETEFNGDIRSGFKSEMKLISIK